MARFAFVDGRFWRCNKEEKMKMLENELIEVLMTKDLKLLKI
ncbi:MAG: hypothetical protein SGI96_12730 [Bacteroidota bacterium]|nr:hypothetical protein [Bacteroidota bacterium]